MGLQPEPFAPRESPKPPEPVPPQQGLPTAHELEAVTALPPTHGGPSAEPPPCPEPTVDTFEHRLSEEPTTHLHAREQDFQHTLAQKGMSASAIEQFVGTSEALQRAP